MPVPSSGAVSLLDLATEFGGSAPHSLGDFYAGGARVPAGTRNGAGTVIPSSGPISLGDFYGAKKWVKSYQTVGDGVGSFNGGNHGTALLRGANTTSGGSAGMPGVDGSGYSAFIALSAGASTLGSAIYPLYSSGVSMVDQWFPLLPSLSDSIGRTANAYSLGTGTVSPAYYGNTNTQDSNAPIFVWTNQYTTWTTEMLIYELGLGSTHRAQVKKAERVWWEAAFAGMDDRLHYGFALLDSRQYSAAYGNTWRNKTIVEVFYNWDTGGEWSSHGFTFNPGVSGTTLTNVGSSAFTKTGSTFRDGGGVVGSLSDYTITLDDYTLVVPVVKSNNGFSGGSRDSNRDPFTARFGYIALS